MTLSTADRREFLKVSSLSAAGLLIGFYLPVKSLAQSEAPNPQEKPTPNPFNAWVHIGKDDGVTLILAKSEMGQGVMTSLPMILADELEVEWRQVRIEQAPTRPEIYEHGTGGSSSVPDSWMPLRRAGAAAREMLITAAAQQWNVDRATCTAQRGAVIHGVRKRRLSYGELAAAASRLPVPDLNTVPLKNPANFSIIGKTTHRVDAPAKTNGTARFGIDTRLPGMVYAVIARCPTFGGKPAKFDAAKAKAVPGVQAVLPIEPIGQGAFSAGGVAVIATSSWAAMQGRRALQVEWDSGPHAEESSETLRQQFLALAAKPGKIVRNDGNADAALAAARNKVEATYELPFAAHACMEPMNCTVHVRPDGVEAWAPTQAPDWARDAIAKVAGVKPEKVEVHTTLMGGGFGRRYQGDFAAEAAQVAKATGKPVQLLWTREDDMQHDFYRPASYHRLSGALSGKGELLAWKHFQTSTSISAWWDPPDKAKPANSEFAAAAFIPYSASNYRVEYALAQSGVPRAWWRSVESSSSGFVVESFVDELAHAAAADPLEFRMRLMGEPRKIPDFLSKEGDPLDSGRLKAVLQFAAAQGGWGKPLPKGQGRGVACFYSFNTYVAGVAEASVEQGEIKVHRVVTAVDCGTPVNPDGIRAQLESAVVYALQAVFKGPITVAQGRVEQANFDTYEMLRINEAPPIIEVHIVPSKEKPTGTGEPCVPVVAPAVANALFAATGKRVRRLPLRAEDFS